MPSQPEQTLAGCAKVAYQHFDPKLSAGLSDAEQICRRIRSNTQSVRSALKISRMS